MPSEALARQSFGCHCDERPTREVAIPTVWPIGFLRKAPSCPSRAPSNPSKLKPDYDGAAVGPGRDLRDPQEETMSKHRGWTIGLAGVGLGILGMLIGVLGAR